MARRNSFNLNCTWYLSTLFLTILTVQISLGTEGEIIEIIPNEEDTIQSLITQLDSESFQIRESAEKELIGKGAKAFSAVKYSLSQISTPETKTRLLRIYTHLAMVASVDIEELSFFAKTEAQQGRFATAAKFYNRLVVVLGKSLLDLKDSKAMIQTKKELRKVEERERTAVAMNRIEMAIKDSTKIETKDLGIEWTDKSTGEPGSIVLDKSYLYFQNKFQRKKFKVPNDW